MVAVVEEEGVGGEKSVGMRYGHTDLCMANSPGVCFPSQPSASVSMRVPSAPLGVTEACVTRQNPMRLYYIYHRGKCIRRNTKKKMDTRAVR